MFTIIIEGEFVNTDEAQVILESEFGAEYDEDTIAFIEVDNEVEAEGLIERMTNRLNPLGDKDIKFEYGSDDEDFDDEDYDDEEYEDEEEDCDCEECEDD